MAEKKLILSVSNLSVKFNEHTILDNIGFDLVRDSTLAVIGPNGAGKTVLFRAILGLIPYTGVVTWASDVRVGYVPQKLSVEKDLPLTVMEFLRFKEKSTEKINKALNSVGFATGRLEHAHNDLRVLNTKMGALSGGELQRVLIAYALLGDPNVILFDEPTSGVDVAGEETIYSLISKLQKDKDLTIIFISHELEVVYKYAENVLCLNKQQVCFGIPREVVDKDSLLKLYGEEMHYYHHHEHHDEHEH